MRHILKRKNSNSIKTFEYKGEKECCCVGQNSMHAITPMMVRSSFALQLS